MTLGSRIKSRRKTLGISVEALAKLVDKNISTIYRYEANDIKTLPLDILEPLALALQTTPNELMGWDLNFVDVNAQGMKNQISQTATVPLYGSITAGTPEEMFSTSDTISIPIEFHLKFPNAFMLTVNGDSMDKIIPNGSYALINPCEDPVDGDVYAVAVNGSEATLKRVHCFPGGMILKPESNNNDHEVKAYDFSKEDCEPVRIIGKLIWFMSPFNIKF